MSERTQQEADYFRYLPPSAGSTPAPTQPAQAAVRADQGQPQERDEQEQLTPEQYEAAIKRAEDAERQSQANAREAEQYRTAMSNQRVQQAEAVWNEAALEARRRATEMHPDDAIQYMENFYQTRENALKQESKNMFMSFAANSWQEKLVQDYGLTEEDMVFLRGHDPNDMEPVARRLKEQREATDARFKALEEQAGDRDIGRYVEQRVRTGAYQSAGGSGRQPALDISNLSARDQLRYVLESGNDI